jgi:hypothetical protein
MLETKCKKFQNGASFNEWGSKLVFMQIWHIQVLMYNCASMLTLTRHKATQNTPPFYLILGTSPHAHVPLPLLNFVKEDKLNTSLYTVYHCHA